MNQGPVTRRENNRSAITAAATQLFLSEGPDSVTTENIAAAAGVAPRTFFNHFASRGELIGAIAHERAVFFAAVVEANASGLPSELLDALAEQIVSYSDRTGPHHREFVAELTRYNATGDIVRDGVLGQSLRAFAERVVAEAGTGAVSAEDFADLLAGAITISIANFASDDSFDLVRAFGGLGRALDALLDCPAQQKGVSND